MASSQVLPLSPSKGVPPLFIRASTLTPPTGAPVNGLEICYDLEKVSGDGTVDCVQRMGDLFRIYPKTLPARENLLINGFSHNNMSFSLLARNPFQVRDEQVRSTKIIIGGVPMSVADSEVEKALLDLDLNLLSDIKYETYRDGNGKWTHFKTGRRFVYVEFPKLNLKPYVQIGLWRASVYYREQIRPKKNIDLPEVTQGSADAVQTEESTAVDPSNQTGASQGTSETTKNQNLKGKQTYALFASKSERDLWSEARGEGFTAPVKARRGRSPTRHGGRRSQLKNNWSQSASRSTSTKRKVSDIVVSSLDNMNKHRKTVSSPHALNTSLNLNTEVSDLC